MKNEPSSLSRSSCQPQVFNSDQKPPYVDDFDILKYWGVLVQYKWIILLAVSISTGGAVIYALYQTPIYRAEVLMVSVNRDGKKGRLTALAGQFSGFATMTGIDLGGNDDTQTAIATLKSRTFTEGFIREMNVLAIIFKGLWDEEKKTWKLESSNSAPSMWKAYKVFNGIRSISEDKRTGLITLAIEWKDPVVAAQWANELVRRINMQLRENAVQASERNLIYLRGQLEKTSVVAIQQSLFNLIETEMKQAMLANASTEYAFRVIDPAVVPEDKVRPKRIRITLMGFMLGVIVGTIFAFMLKLRTSLRQ